MTRPSRIAISSMHRSNEKTDFRPQLTSLIDVMTFLLVFLIKSFSVEGDIITPSSNLDLPNSITQKPPRPATSIEITKTSIIADGRSIASLSGIFNTDEMLIDGVYRWILQHASPVADAQPRDAIIIQADRDTEYSILKKVMYSCSKAGFTDFSILAIQSE